MCDLLEVSRNGYYAWRKRPMCKTKKETLGIIKVDQKNFEEYRGMCGLYKMLRDVREVYPKCIRKRLYNI